MTDNQNEIIKILQEKFLAKSEKYEKSRRMSRHNFFSLIFENNLFDIYGFDVFKIAHLLDQLLETRGVTFLNFEMFLDIITFIYIQQRLISNPSAMLDVSEDISSFSNNHVKADLTEEKVLKGDANIIKALIERNNLDLFTCFCFPSMDNDRLEKLIERQVLTEIAKYKDNLQRIFNMFAKSFVYSKISFLTLFDLVLVFWNNCVAQKFNESIVSECVINYLNPYSNHIKRSSLEELFKDAIVKKEDLSKNPDIVQMMIKYDYINFSFSTFALLLSDFVFEEVSEYASLDEVCAALKKYFEIDIGIEENQDTNNDIDYQEEDNNKEDDKNQWESETLTKNRKSAESPNNEDHMNFQDVLTLLDKDLPLVPASTVCFQNPVVDHKDTLYLSKRDTKKIKFPLGRYEVERVEELEEALKKKEDKMIEKAKKVQKSNKKEGVKRPVVYEDQPNPQEYLKKQLGYKTIQDLNSRYLKHSYVDKMMNTRVYPSLLKDILVLPNFGAGFENKEVI